MTYEEFMYYLEAYGASLHRWPRELRETARAFLASSSPAVAAQDETARLDALLDRLALTPDRGSETRVTARAQSIAARSTGVAGGHFVLRVRAAALWPRAAALAAVAVLGILTGSLQLASPQSETPALDVAQLRADDSPFEVAGL